MRRTMVLVAKQELEAGAKEIGGNNQGPFVEKYLNPSGIRPPQPWCAAFVSWCLRESARINRTMPPLPYFIRARSFYRDGLSRGLLAKDPQPGDIVVWWRGRKDGPLGHVGIVELRHGQWIQTIEGNRTTKVARFTYDLGRMPRLLGFVRIPG
ncbi:MAG: CHAP domain-containing protein [Fimbriimonadales bacterium]|nr:CHAP domain-containing protein [Fimbriimonadales bacterium]